MKYLFVLLMVISFNVFAHEETEQWQIVANTFLVADWLQTRDIADDPNRTEMNVILGEQPTTGEVNRYFMTSIVLVNGLGSVMNHQNETNLYRTIAILQIITVLRNHRLGVSFRF